MATAVSCHTFYPAAAAAALTFDSPDSSNKWRAGKVSHLSMNLDLKVLVRAKCLRHTGSDADLEGKHSGHYKHSYCQTPSPSLNTGS